MTNLFKKIISLSSFFTSDLMTKVRLRSLPNLSIVNIKETSIILGCFELIQLINRPSRLLYRGKHLYEAGHNVASITVERVLLLYREVTEAAFDHILLMGYKIRFQSVNTDIITDTGRMLCRGSDEELKTFLYFNRLSKKDKIKLLKQLDLPAEDLKFRYDPRESAKLGFDVPPSGPPNGRGLAPDYSELPEYLFNGDQRFGKIEFQMTGSRDVDESLLNAQFGLTKEMLKEQGFVWHHLDDVRVNEAGELACTMQLVRKDVHNKIIVQSLKGQIQDLDDFVIANEHVGAVAIWKNFYLAKYK